MVEGMVRGGKGGEGIHTLKKCIALCFESVCLRNVRHSETKTNVALRVFELRAGWWLQWQWLGRRI